MILGVLFILLAWYVDMPLWLSILTTVIGGIRILAKMTVYLCKIIQAATEKEKL